MLTPVKSAAFAVVNAEAKSKLAHKKVENFLFIIK